MGEVSKEILFVPMSRSAAPVIVIRRQESYRVLRYTLVGYRVLGADFPSNLGFGDIWGSSILNDVKYNLFGAKGDPPVKLKENKATELQDGRSPFAILIYRDRANIVAIYHHSMKPCSKARMY